MLVSTVACAPRIDGDGDGDDGSAGDGSTSEGSTSEGSTSGEPQGPECAPADASLTLQVDPSVLDGDCEVVAPVDGATISFQCEGAQGRLQTDSMFISVTPALPLTIAIGTQVTLAVLVSSSNTDEPVPRRSVFVRDAATHALLLATIDAHDTAWTDELTPLTLSELDAACTAVPDASNCLANQRIMWNAQHGDASAPVGDGTRTQVGSYAVHLQRATRGEFLDCLDVENEFYQALIVRTQ